MTTAPESLRQLGTYWQANGGVNLGIVGNQKHCSGYHLGRDRIHGACACRPKDICVPGLGAKDYSVQHARDKAGLSNAASAIDLGKLNGSLDQLYAFSRWLVARCQAQAPGTDDIREVIYWNPAMSRVERYSGMDGAIHTGPGNGDLSHRTHTHISYFRDSERRDKRTAFIPFFAGLPPTDTEDVVEIEAKHERWTLDGGPGQVTTVGAPIVAGKADYSRRLALTSGAGDTNRRYRLIDRSRLTFVSGAEDDPLYRALASYDMPAADCADAVEAAIKADRDLAYVAYREE